ncbi:MAG: divergent polysaccharide deacetylase family protein [Hyphomicrobiaceae bacterium]|nr:divergent polysaccharide deacetylase family protein [Hyphomicrobiaceae bacterium]
MAVSAILKGVRVPRLNLRTRPMTARARISALSWAVAVIALVAVAASSLNGGKAGASAFVTTGTAHASETAPEIETVRPLADPATYRRAAPAADGRPRVAVIVRGLGLSARITGGAIADLPPDVTLALSAYGRDLQKDADAARADGHEVFLDVPVEPQGYPANDAGPQALLTSLSAAENAQRLEWSMARFTGFPGLVFAPGSPALESAETMAPLFDKAGPGGLVWAHAGAKGFDGARVETAAAAVTLPASASAADADAAFERLNALARKSGAALIIVTPAPTTLTRLKIWIGALENEGIVLVPASALAVAPAS